MQPQQQDTTRLFQDVKRAANLATYIEQATGTAPKKSGASLFFNPCPLCQHRDCFALYGQEKDAYKCHSCGDGGDIFTFAEKFKNMSKGEALKDVAKFAGVPLPDLRRAQRPADNPLQRVLEAAVTYYAKVLEGSADMLAWLTLPKPEGRGHTQQTLQALEVGVSDGKLAEALQAQGFSLEEVKAAGLYVESKNEPGQWRDFFMPGLCIFPHRLPAGEIAHFTLKDPRKKVNYQFKAEHRLDGFVFGNQKAIRADKIILVEGENDLASFFDAGERNVLASLGSLSDDQTRWLDVHSHGKTFYLWFDYDTQPGDKGQPPAGIRYTRKTYQRLLKNKSCQVLVVSGLMDPGEDPDDWIQKDLESAPKRIAAALKKAHNPLLWELRVMPDDVRADADASLRYFEAIEFFDHLGLLPDLHRDAVIVEMQKLGFSRDAIMSSIKDTYGLREQLDALLDSFNGSTRSDSYKRTVAAAVWDFFKQRGRFFVSGDKLHLFYHHTIYQIGDNVPFKALMHKEAGINYKQDVAGFVWEELKALCFTRGDRLKEFGWISLFPSDEGPVLYLNLKDPANRILRITSGNVDIAENGTNSHNVLLAESGQMEPFTYDPEANIAAAMRDMKRLMLDSLACPPAQRYLLLAWALSAYLMPITSSRALMKLEGGSGSGKTTAAETLSLLLYGKSMVGRSSTASDYSMAATEPLIIKDNLETDDINRNSLNFLLLAATGATNIKRLQGTDSGVVTEKINCLVAITAIEPLSKPELINRAFTIEFNKRWQRNDFGKDDNNRRILARRGEILSAWLQVIAERVLPNLDECRELVAYIREHHKDYSKDRVSEFTALLALIAKALLHYIPLSAELKMDKGSRQPEYVLLDAWIKYQNEHSRQTEQGTNAVLQLLDGLRRVFLIDFSKRAQPAGDTVWCELMGVTVERAAVRDSALQPTGFQTYAFEASTADLLAMINRYSREYGLKAPFSNARQLGVRIANEMDTLCRAGWEITPVKIVRGNRVSRWAWSDADHPTGCD